MKDKNIFYIKHILEAASDIQKFLRKYDERLFMKSDLLQSAVIRKFEIIGEAAKRVSDDFKKESEDIEWRKISGMRDVLIHDYFGIDLKGVWNTATKDIPVLIKKLKKFI